MILMRAFGYWLMCTGVDRDRGIVGARCGVMMPHPEGLVLDHPKSSYKWGMLPFDESRIEFYPVLHWRGVTVVPWVWTHTSEEPLLKCEASIAAIAQAVDCEAGSRQEAREARVEVMEHAGWSGNAHVGWCKWCHADELDKERGPAPG
ncbi:MAG: hypothetical protein AAFV77_12820, partial [Planctomycetota bacterium]